MQSARFKLGIQSAWLSAIMYVLRTGEKALATHELQPAGEENEGGYTDASGFGSPMVVRVATTAYDRWFSHFLTKQ